jgi:hypothetical protein
MRIFAPILVILCTIGCNSTSHLQCDEVYAHDYNCDLSQRNIYTPSSNPYFYYYPHMETVYYVPVYVPVSPSNEQKPVRKGPRPSITGRNTQ